MPVDPVCEMEVSAEDAVATSEYNGQTYHFCSQECKDSFDEDPEMFIGEMGEDEAAAAA
jgi:3-hydroxybutyryl-CoA dehydratase